MTRRSFVKRLAVGVASISLGAKLISADRLTATNVPVAGGGKLRDGVDITEIMNRDAARLAGHVYERVSRSSPFLDMIPQVGAEIRPNPAHFLDRNQPKFVMIPVFP